MGLISWRLFLSSGRRNAGIASKSGTHISVVRVYQCFCESAMPGGAPMATETRMTRNRLDTRSVYSGCNFCGS